MPSAQVDKLEYPVGVGIDADGAVYVTGSAKQPLPLMART